MGVLAFLACAALCCHMVGAQVPASPYGDADEICAAGNGPAFDFEVDGFPGTPYVITPFVDEFSNPPELKHVYEACHSDDGHCLRSYEINVYDERLHPFDNIIPTCASKPGTWFLT